MTELIQIIAQLSAGDATHWAAVVYEAKPRVDGKFNLILKGMQVMEQIGELETIALLPTPNPLLPKHFRIDDVVWTLGSENDQYVPIFTQKGKTEVGQYLSDHKEELFPRITRFAYLDADN